MSERATEPSVRVSREATNYRDGQIACVKCAMTEWGLTQIKVQTVPSVTLLAPEEVRAFCRAGGFPLSDESALDMADYIDENFPPSADECLDILTQPLIVCESLRARKPNTRYLVGAVDDPRIMQERDAARELVHGFTGIDSHVEWSPSDTSGKLYLIRFSSWSEEGQQTDFDYNLVELGRLLPSTTALDVVLTEDITDQSGLL